MLCLDRSHLSLATGLIDQRVERFAVLRDHNNTGSSKHDHSEGKTVLLLYQY
ncbi:hypothetical protein DPMN_069231 [Dreissena polymorpha]|uniref:Uncharacterized protein n=1 Tax=Dreissena polymorpha TaxID=45954 RepID=A0A9D3Z3Q4_DREPO|nr:hypothetical protein DPMN_069231 [Dreissena polymorpha]